LIMNLQELLTIKRAAEKAGRVGEGAPAGD
jgi:hypothetical protein